MIEPFHEYDFFTCFIDAESYINMLDEKDEEERDYLLKKSNFEDLHNALNKVISKNNLAACLLTPLHRAQDILEKIYNILSIPDDLSRNLLEILRRKINLVKASKNRFIGFYKNELNKLEYDISMTGDEIADKIDGIHSQKEVKEVLEKSENTIESMTRAALDKIGKGFNDELTRLKNEYDDLEKTSIGEALRSGVAIPMTGKKNLAGGEFDSPGSISGALVIGKEVMKELGGFASKATRDTVYNVVKFFGGKFKP